MRCEAILVVDDEAVVLEVLTSALEVNGYQVLAVRSAAEALKAVRSVSPDLAIIDLVMPGINGVQLVDELRRAGVDCPVLYISGLGDSELANRLQPGRREDSLPKPFGAQALLQRVERLLQPLLVMAVV